MAVNPPPIDGLGNSGGFALRLQDRGGLGRAVQVRAVVEHDVGRLAAAFQPDALEVRFAGIGHEPLARGGGSREGHAIHVRVQAQCLAGHGAQARHAFGRRRTRPGSAGRPFRAGCRRPGAPARRRQRQLRPADRGLHDIGRRPVAPHQAASGGRHQRICGTSLHRRQTAVPSARGAVPFARGGAGGPGADRLRLRRAGHPGGLGCAGPGARPAQRGAVAGRLSAGLRGRDMVGPYGLHVAGALY
ncbi:hypothetical protein G6F68_012398 [Rhizopus microsporus]|nr:hypothetical protein G6F68_012398 [Rhizopus microsporus]